MADGANDLARAGAIGVGIPGSARSEGVSGASYYDVPMLKASEWTWMVPVYFSTGGLAGASFILSRLADRLGGDRLRPLARTAAWASAAGYAASPPLLILDLGDPRRFHHMLRIFKATSPMSVGSWTLAAFGGPVSLMALRELIGDRNPFLRAILAPADTVGIPLALMMTGYTGVLISTTSTPIWTQNPWLGPLFTASAFEIAGAVSSLALELSGKAESPSTRALKPLKIAARLATAVTAAGYLTSAGDLGKPLTRGKYAPHLWLGAVVGGLVLPTLLEEMGERSRQRPRTASALKAAASLAGLVGGFLLKWSIGSAGHVSGRDPEAGRNSTRRRSGNDPAAG